jgi:capsid protein
MGSSLTKPARERARPRAEQRARVPGARDNRESNGRLGHPGEADTVKNQKALDAWKAWAGTTACDADGRHDFYGLQKLVMRAIVESGEVLVRRRFRLPEDGLPIPMQLQILEADYIDTSRTGIRTAERRAHYSRRRVRSDRAARGVLALS